MASRLFILALPRSRTAWLSNWLSFGDTMLLHEPLSDTPTLEILEDKLKALGTKQAGIADTAASFLVERLTDKYPKAKFIVVQRDPQEVARSLRMLGMDGASTAMLQGVLDDAKAHLVASGVDYKEVSYHDLDKLDCLENLWVWATGTPHNPHRTNQLLDFVITVDASKLAARISTSLFELTHA